MAESNSPSPEKFSPAELTLHRTAAERGETPTLEIVRKFIITIRKNFLASPKAVEKGKTTRNAKPKVDESQIDFF